MVAAEHLGAESADYVPCVVVIRHIVEGTVVVLCKSLAAHSLRLNQLTVGIINVQSELLAESRSTAELIVVAVTISVVYGSVVAPMLRRLPNKVEAIMVLIEVVGSLIPLASVAEVERLGRETTAVGRRIYKVFHERVVSSQTIIIHILIAVDTIRRERVAFIVTRCNTVPCLTGLLEVADVLVAQLEVAAYPCQSAVVRTRTSACAMYIAVGVGLMIGTVEDKAVADEVGREVDASVPSVVRAERTGQFNVRNS